MQGVREVRVAAVEEAVKVEEVVQEVAGEVVVEVRRVCSALPNGPGTVRRESIAC